MTKIIQLTAENVKRLRAVQIKPDGNLVVVGGANGAGKSSVLDSITYALAGKGAQPSEPIRRGEDSASIVLETEDLIVHRTMTKSGSYLTVENRDGARYNSPQSVLDKLTDTLTFDPLAFTRLGRAEQIDRLRDLVGLDFSEEDKRRSEIYDDRRMVNRRVRDLEAQVEAAPHHDDAPDEQTSVGSLAQELKRRQAVNKEVADAREEVERCEAGIETVDERIAELEAQLEKTKASKKKGEKALTAAKKALDKLEPEDEDEIAERLERVEQDNRKWRENKEREALEEDLENERVHSEKLTKEIEEIDKAKQDAIAAAEFPIPGLSFSDEAVLYEGIPFDQASQAEQIRVSVAIGLAMNPDLNVLLVRDGSLLDADNLRMIAEMAEEADAQVWVERVGEGEEVSVVIEDGAVKTAEPVEVA